MDISVPVVTIFVVVAVVAPIIGYFIGRSRAKPNGHRPGLHRLLITFLGLVLLAWPVLIGHVMWQVWPVVEEIAASAEEGDPSDEPMDADVDEAPPADDDATNDDDDGHDDDGTPRAGDGLDQRTITLVNNDVTVSPGQAYLLLAAVFGAAGAFIHSATSFATFLGNRKFKISWGWWYALRPFIGTAVAIVLVVAIIGGLVALTSQTSAVEPANLNPYTVAAFGALAGWFSKLVADKLQDIFSVTLSSAADKARADGLETATPAITGAALVKVGDGYKLTLTGADFTDGSTVRIDGVDHPAKLVGADLVVMLSDKPESQTIVVTNHAERESDGFDYSESGEAPAITEATAVEREGGGFVVTIAGTGFGKAPTATIDGAEVDVTVTAAGPLTTFVAALRDDSTVVVTAGSGEASEPASIVVSSG